MTTLSVFLAQPKTVHDPDLLQFCQSLLNTEEQIRWAKIKIARIQHEYLIAHALLRLSLTRCAPLAPKAWQFIRNQYGRPEIANPDYSWLRFNLSHTRNLVACAILPEHAVGIDVEILQRQNHTQMIAERFFSTTECTELRSNPADQQAQRFFDYWTLKEAFIKAKGMGLALPLGQFGFQLQPMPDIRLYLAPELNDNPERWAFNLYAVAGTHRLALCYECPGTPPKISLQALPELPITLNIESLGESRHAQTLAQTAQREIIQ